MASSDKKDAPEKDATAATAAGQTVRLKATQTGYDGLRIIKEEEEFDVVIPASGEIPFWAKPVSKRDAAIPQEEIPRTQTQAEHLPEGTTAVI